MNSPGWTDINDWATWATKRVDELTHESTFYYGSAWFTYGDINTLAGNYVVRSSGYCRFRDEKNTCGRFRGEHYRDLYQVFAGQRCDGGLSVVAEQGVRRGRDFEIAAVCS